MMDPIHLDSEKHLFFDDHLVATKSGFFTTVQPPLGREGPLIVADRDWEAKAIYPWLSVVQVGDLLRLWYSSADEDFHFHLCYAESTDGRHWEKPDCGVVEYHRSRANNIVYDGDGEVVGPVFRDPHAPAEKRYKGVFPGPHLIDPGARCLRGAFSPDGIHWRPCEQEQIVPWYYDTLSSAFWDERVGRYVLYCRDNVGWTHRSAPYYRAVNRTESIDFESFPEPTRILEAAGPDPKEGQLYNPGVLPYPFAPNTYWALPSGFHREDLFDLRLFTSRDGLLFQEPRDAPFLTVGPAGGFDAMMIAVGNGCVDHGDEVWLYYGGFSAGHTAFPGVLNQSPHPRMGGIGLIRTRRDGFVSQSAGRTLGRLLTHPLTFTGNRLQVNMNASAEGWLQVELLSASGGTLANFTSTDADPLYGNDLRKTVTWQGQSDVSALSGRPVQLCFTGAAVDLYAFQFLHGAEGV